MTPRAPLFSAATDRSNIRKPTPMGQGGGCPTRNQIKERLNNEKTVLRLSQMSIKALPDDIFHDFKQLQKLDLQGNQISSLPDRIFSGLIQLQEINLSNNLIQALPPGIFFSLSQLRILDCKNNQLQTLHSTLFKNSTQLRYLDLSSNDIESLPPAIFNNLNQLERLNLDANPMSTLPISINSLSKKMHLWISFDLCRKYKHFNPTRDNDGNWRDESAAILKQEQPGSNQRATVDASRQRAPVPNPETRSSILVAEPWNNANTETRNSILVAEPWQSQGPKDRVFEAFKKLTGHPLTRNPVTVDGAPMELILLKDGELQFGVVVHDVLNFYPPKLSCKYKRKDVQFPQLSWNLEEKDMGARFTQCFTEIFLIGLGKDFSIIYVDKDNEYSCEWLCGYKPFLLRGDPRSIESLTPIGCGGASLNLDNLIKGINCGPTCKPQNPNQPSMPSMPDKVWD